ncbi:hypothetical protein GFL09_04160 [Pseudomonas stutzeri]|jgi:hypothetical protein|uniref:hypothetical protein n=1 Tax=Stutzerimonas stutzeri TaxID=316 RepID=UPI00190DB818|nr:hypothetical protein [Stutzerimonas stutzeri]MBK3866887.1 hypothetical protein [Stutzerimonas stutzeri]
MSLKTLRAEIQRTADQLRSETTDLVGLVLIDVVDASEEGEEPIPCVGYTCDFALAGKRRRLFFKGPDPEPVANALFDHAHRIERTGRIRPVPVLMASPTTPDDALTIEQTPEGITTAEHVARLYDALRATHD